MHPLSLKLSGGEVLPTPKISKNKQSSPREDKTNEVSKKIGKSQQAGAHKDISATLETKNPKVSNLAYQKILQKYQDSPDELDISEDGIVDLYKALDKLILPMDKGSAFCDTDLIIIDDAFKGNMPLNGIIQSEMKHIEQLFKNICAGKENIKIITKEANDPFKNNTENLIKKLLTRNIGRKLIQKIIESSFLPKLEILPGEISSFKHAELKIFLSEPDAVIIASHPTGKLKCQILPNFLSLAHELVHATHQDWRDPGRSASFSDKYDNAEEQLTITGYEGFDLNLSLEKKK